MQNLYGYDVLIQKFLDGALSADQFEQTYLDKYLADDDDISEELFLILDWLFAEVDYYSNDPATHPDAWIDAKQLRESAAKTLKELQALRDAG